MRQRVAGSDGKVRDADPLDDRRLFARTGVERLAMLGVAEFAKQWVVPLGRKRYNGRKAEQKRSNGQPDPPCRCIAAAGQR
jgi:hypothetical protein